MLNVRSMLRVNLGLKCSMLKPQSFQRLQSTVSNATVNEQIVPEVEEEHHHDDSSFKIFPRMQDVSVNDLVGVETFGPDKYFVSRSTNGNLPVYTDFKNGLTYTEVRKIQGNSIKLRDDLIAKMPNVDERSFKVVPQSNKILIKGDHTTQVKKVLSTTF